ncbi:putative nuclease HARBI1 [Ornithodoros turicata]|uniref:putative nuclease HARBI1 n=1 Tax=Ornithodoros turicata TaxID=34597 RepID=UPI003138C6FD
MDDGPDERYHVELGTSSSFVLQEIVMGGMLIVSVLEESLDDDTNERERQRIPKVSEYAEETIRDMSSETCKSHFRLLPRTIQQLSTILGPLLGEGEVGCGRPQVPAQKQLLITVWCLANMECFRGVGDRLGVAKSTAYVLPTVATAFHCVRRVGEALLKVASRFVLWPSESDALSIIDGFQRKFKFPGVLGAVDGSHIAITAPKEHAASYINRKGFYSVVLQAVCDHEMRFLHCSVGEAGSMHDARVVRRSELHDMLDHGHFPFSSHLVGDAAYPIGPNLLTPYRDNGHLSTAQKCFNKRLCRARVTIERAFGLLKNRYRRLFRVETRRPDIIVTIMITACVLHNACLLWCDTFEDPSAVGTQDDLGTSEHTSAHQTKRLGM